MTTSKDHLQTTKNRKSKSRRKKTIRCLQDDPMPYAAPSNKILPTSPSPIESPGSFKKAPLLPFVRLALKPTLQHRVARSSQGMGSMGLSIPHFRAPKEPRLPTMPEGTKEASLRWQMRRPSQHVPQPKSETDQHSPRFDSKLPSICN